MTAINRVLLVGTVEARPTHRPRAANQHVTTFHLVTTETWTDKKGVTHSRTARHPVIVWGKLAKSCGSLSAGQRCYVEGKLQLEEFEDREGRLRSSSEVLASAVVFLPDDPAPAAARPRSSRPIPEERL